MVPEPITPTSIANGDSWELRRRLLRERSGASPIAPLELSVTAEASRCPLGEHSEWRNGKFGSQAGPCDPFRKDRIAPPPLSRRLGDENVGSTSAVLSWLDLSYMNDVFVNIQDPGHLDVLAFKRFGFFLIVQVHTFSSLLVHN